MSKVKELITDNGVQKPEKIQLPKVLADRLQSEHDAASARIEQINAGYRQTVTLLITGYEASLGQGKKYSLSSDLKYLVENERTQESTG